MSDQIFAHQFLIQGFGDIVFDYQRMPGTEAITSDKRIIHFCFDIHQRLIDTDHPRSVGFIDRLSLLQQRIAGVDGEIVFGFTFTGKFHFLRCK
ncbi:hypothetical protein D3C85_1129400 [compost metagenome]